MNKPRKYNPEAGTLLPDQIQAPRKTTPLESTLSNVEPTPQTREKSRGSSVKAIITAVAIGAAAAAGLYKASHPSTPTSIDDQPVSTALSDASSLMNESRDKIDPACLNPADGSQALKCYIERDSVLLTPKDFEGTFEELPENTRKNTKFIQMMRLITIQTEDGEHLTWAPVTSALSECKDTGSCIYAIRATKERYSGLVTFYKNHKPADTYRDPKNPDILYAAFNKPGFTAVEVRDNQKILFLMRMKLQPGMERKELLKDKE